SAYGSHDISGFPDRPFSQRMQGIRFDGVHAPVDVVRFTGTVQRMTWASRGQEARPSWDFVLVLNRRPSPLSLTHPGPDVVLDLECAGLLSCTDAGDFRAADAHDFSVVAIDQEPLRRLVDRVDDLIARPLPRGNAALRHLQRYLDILPTVEDTEGDVEFL